MKRGFGYWFGGIVLAALATAALFSCNRPPDVSPAKALNLSVEERTADYNTEKISLTIKATLDWKLSVAADAKSWIAPNVTSGKAGTSAIVDFTLGTNTTGARRTGKVTVSTDDGSESSVFTITQNQENVLTGVNEWIFEQMKGWYYWNDAVKSATPPSNALGYEDFLEELITGIPLDKVKDTSNGENPATIDGSWAVDETTGIRSDSRGHIYSYIERTGGDTRAGASNVVEFGFDIKPFYLTGGQPGQYGLLVIWVRPGGPADKAGVKRGMWIKKYYGADIFEPDYENFWNRLHYFRGGTGMTFTDGNGKLYNLTAAETKVSPIILNKVIDSGRKKIAYLVYNQFDPGSNGEFDEALAGVFGEFKSAGVTELVLDLRYNRGGYVSSCRLLSSLAANVNSGQAFVKMKRNKDLLSVYRENPQVLKFYNESNSLKLNKIYILATRDSSSASEMVINALRGVDIEVIHIGTRTGGKNVGMDARDVTLDGYAYTMWPVTFKSLNAKDFTDYADGFEPTYYLDEFRDVKDSKESGKIYELGDTNERLLNAALTLIKGSAVTPDSKTTRAAYSEREPAPAPGRLPGEGVKYRPDPERQ